MGSGGYQQVLDLPGRGRRRTAGDQGRVPAPGVRQPGLRQIDGIGGATSTTSKAIIVETRRAGQAADLVRYSFAQVSVDHPRVEWLSNCGNCATALALYAVQHELVELADDVTEFAMVNMTTGLVLRATVPTPGRDRTLTRRPTGPRRAVPRACRSTWASPSRPGPPTERCCPPATRSISLTVGGTGIPGHPDRRRRPGRGRSRRVDRPDRRGRRRSGRREDAVLRRTAAQRRPRHGTARQRPVSSQGRHRRPWRRCSAELNARMISMSAPHPAIGLTSAVALAAAATIPGSLVHDVAPAPAGHTESAPSAVRSRSQITDETAATHGRLPA